MGKDVRFDDVRQLFQVLNDTRGEGDAASTQLHILKGICRILHARIATSGLVSGLDRGAFDLTHSQCVGVSHSEAEHLFSSYASHGSNGDPLLHRVLALPRAAGVRVHSRRELVSDTEWHSHVAVAGVRTSMYLDDTIHAYHSCGPGELVGFQIVRDAADASFDERDRNLVELMVLEAGFCLAPRPNAVSPQLTQRERQTLDCLLSGDSEKQVADKLGLSIHTVHDYVKRLHRAFKVASRGELLARVAGSRIARSAQPDEPVVLPRPGGFRAP